MSGDKDVFWARHCDPESCTSDPIEAENSCGKLPDWLSGVLYRTGPGVQKFGEDQYLHAFDGIAILHAVEIHNGKAKYRNRVLESDSFKKNMEANRISVTEFGTFATPDPCITILGKFANRFLTIPKIEDATDNGAVNVFFHGDELFASTETNKIRRVDPATLKTFNGATHHSQIPGLVAVHRATAHPHSDPDGTLYNFGSGMYRGKRFHSIIKFPPPLHGAEGQYQSSHDQAIRVADVPARHNWHLPYFHSFGMSENYFILPESPMTMNMRRGLFMNMTQTPPVDFFDWDPNGTSTFILIHRDTGKIHPVRYDARAFACFHHINAYEKEGQIVVDLCVSEGDLYGKLYIEALKNGTAKIPPSDPIRFVLPLEIPDDAGVETNLVTLNDTACQAFKMSENLMRVTEESLAKDHMEMPRINYGWNTKPYRFFYSVYVDMEKLDFSRLYKNDVNAKTCVGAFAEEDIWVSEPVFVGRPGSDEEDDGIVLTLLTKRDDLTYVGLLALDAKTFQEVARFNFRAKGPVTPTLHGTFNPNPGSVFA